jgi:tRNA pseudouridine32 synthase/23S rRNA pseudouridine746 synthase
MQDEPEPSSQDIVRRLLYRDALMLVIDKPAGLAVHPDVKNGATLVDQLDRLRFGLPRRPELAHRLDRDTSGCLVLGRHRKALARLGRLFAAGTVSKVYWAVVAGGPADKEGEIALPLARRDPRGWDMQVDPAGQPALTRWRVVARGEGMSFLALEPVTGRTHQLRVHCAAMGWPILGDRIYGPDAAPSLRLMLHARAVSVPLYPKRTAIHVEAPVPEEMQGLLRRCGWVDESGLSVQARF